MSEDLLLVRNCESAGTAFRVLIIAEPRVKLDCLSRRPGVRVLRRRPMGAQGQRENEKNCYCSH
jgi:hypothetical protein